VDSLKLSFEETAEILRKLTPGIEVGTFPSPAVETLRKVCESIGTLQNPEAKPSRSWFHENCSLRQTEPFNEEQRWHVPDYCALECGGLGD
jgi:hypothetical protein